MILYIKNIEGRLDEALQEPQTLVMLIVPFLPVVVLSFMAERAQNKLIEMLQGQGDDTPPPPAPETKKK